MLGEFSTGHRERNALLPLLAPSGSPELAPAALCCPIFLLGEGSDPRPSPSIPEFSLHPLPALLGRVEVLRSLGMRSVLLYAASERRDETGSSSADPNGLVQRAVRLLRAQFPDLVIMTDLGLCQYTAHGHCGIFDGATMRNDETLEILQRQALTHAEAGADVLVPSVMADGAVAQVRAILDEKGFPHVAIISQAAKFHSALYRPFRRTATGSAPVLDKRTYQVDPANRQQALREAEIDLAEGAAMVMVKPAFGYFDVLRQIKDTFRTPVAAFCTSGECSLLEQMATEAGVPARLFWRRYLQRLKDAGADFVVSYRAEVVL